jgi:FkbM family methyltransferase
MVDTPGNIVESDIDRIVYEHFFAGRNGVFVDVGAARPDFLSISALYRGKGWRVIAIEPNPEFCDLHKKAGHEIVQCACGERDEDNVDFTIVDQHGGDYLGGKVSYESFSSLGIKKEFSQLKSDLDTKIIKVNVRRLDSLLGSLTPHVGQVDILSIDVEGWEMEVLDGFDSKQYRPHVMIVENLFCSPQYVSRLNDEGYVLWRRYFPNDVYVSSSAPLFIRRIYSRLAVSVHKGWAALQRQSEGFRGKFRKLFH